MLGRTWIISSISTGTERFFDQSEVTQPRNSNFLWDACYPNPKLPLSSGPQFLYHTNDLDMALFGHFQLWMLQAGKSPHISVTFLRVTLTEKEKKIPICRSARMSTSYVYCHLIPTRSLEVTESQK